MAIGVTKRDFVVTVNGEHILKCSNSFLARPFKFEVTKGDDLNLEIRGVDTYVMGEGSEVAPQLPPIDAKFEIVESKKSRKRLTDKILSKIFNH